MTVFQEFIQRYQSSLEQAAVSGRAILPKPPSPPSLPLQDPHLHPLTNSTDPQEYLTPQIPSNVNKNLETSLDLSHFVSNPLTAANVPSSTVPPSADQQAQVIALPLEDAALQSTVPGLNVTFISSLSNVVSISQSTTTVSVSRMNCEAVQATPTAVSQSITVAPSVGPASQPQLHCTGLMAITENTMAADSSTHSQHQHQTASMVSCIPARSSLIFDTPVSESAAPQMVTPSAFHPHHNEHSQHGLLSEHQQLIPSVDITEVIPKGFERESQNDRVSSSLPPALQETQQATTITCALTQDSVPQMSDSESQQLTDSHPGTGNPHPSRIALPNSIVNFSPAPLSLYGFTQGTIQSPEKPAHANAQAFVRVEDFLSVLAAQTPRGKNPLQESVKLDPHTGLVATTQSSLLRSPPSGVQPLVNLSILSQLLNMPQPSIPDTVKAAVVGTPSTSRHSTPLQANHPGSLVNQRPISATGEVKGKKKSAVSAGAGDAKSNFKLPENSVSTPQNNSLPSSPYLPVVPPQISASGLPLGFTNPNTLLSNPPRFLPRQTLTPNTTPGFIPLVPNFSLPPFSTLCVPSVTSGEPAATMQHAPDASASDESPPKRVKLE